MARSKRPASRPAKTTKKKVRRSYTIAFKRAAVKHFEMTNSKNKTANNLQVPRQCLIAWVKQSEELFSRDRPLSRRKVCKLDKKRKPLNIESEERLYEWFLEQREKGHVISPRDLQNKMREFINEYYKEDPPKFNASYGWLQRFLNRNNLVNNHRSHSNLIRIYHRSHSKI